MWRDFFLFWPLAVLTNTAFPFPFDPVLIYFAGRHPALTGVFAVGGSLCAAAAGVIDAKLMGKAGGWVPAPCARFIPEWGGVRFYALTFIFAFAPLPFSVIRVAILRGRPRPLLYGAAVGLGRLPRYLMTVYLWRSLTQPGWAKAAALLSIAALVIHQLVRRAGGGLRDSILRQPDLRPHLADGAAQAAEVGGQVAGQE